jgi:hypothetical protein
LTDGTRGESRSARSGKELLFEKFGLLSMVFEQFDLLQEFLFLLSLMGRPERKVRQR